MSIDRLAGLIRTVPDFPSRGILFRDITPLLGEPVAFAELADALCAPYLAGGADAVVAVESRGFFLGAAMALRMQLPLVLARKPGKLPLPQVTRDYGLEYGTASLGIIPDAVKPGWRTIIVDDLLATGGTARAAAEIVEEIGGEVVGLSFAIELEGLPGREALAGWPVHSVLTFPAAEASEAVA